MDKATLALRQEFPGDWSDDLTALGEKLLVEAEQIYGERDRAWTFLGVQWGDKNVTWPIDKQRKFACICLHELLPSHLPDFLPFNLAHEVVHMLCPPDRDNVTYLEEGVAVSFSLGRSIYGDARYIGEQLKIFEKYPDDKYTVAWKDVGRLIASEPSVISKLRSQEKSLSCISAAQIIAVAPNCDKAVAERLASKFSE
jgi:hypothetical protein